jgi:hypothetical protein
MYFEFFVHIIEEPFGIKRVSDKFTEFLVGYRELVGSQLWLLSVAH